MTKLIRRKYVGALGAEALTVKKKNMTKKKRGLRRISRIKKQGRVLRKESKDGRNKIAHVLSVFRHDKII